MSDITIQTDSTVLSDEDTDKQLAILRSNLLLASDHALASGLSYAEVVAQVLGIAVDVASYAPDSNLLSDEEFKPLVGELYDVICETLMSEPALNYHHGQAAVIGIDIGVSGAIAVLDAEAQLIAFTDMPTYQAGKSKRVNPAALSAFLAPYRDAHTIVEQVGAMPKQGVVSMFNFGHSAGVVEGVLASLGISYELVTPQTWKRAYKLTGKPKDTARAIAQRYYPSVPLSRKKDIGLADALLIGRLNLPIR